MNRDPVTNDSTKLHAMLAWALSNSKRAFVALLTSPGSAPFGVRVPRRMVAIRQSLRSLVSIGRNQIDGTFDPLTPAKLHGAEYSRYRAELQRALRLPKVRNIAVTGSYGAGKSSFIQSFVEDHSEYNFCFVSLATFSEAEVAKEAGASEALDEGSNKVDNSNENQPAEQRGASDPLERIEASIVQQLLYSVRDSSIPQTRLKRIKHVRAGAAALYSAFLAAAASATLSLFGLPKSLNHLEGEIPFEYILAASPGLCAAGLLIGSVAIAYGALSSVIGFKLHSVSVKGLSLTGPSTMSVLHKQLDEIVYLFERTKIDVVLIEDLDRFNDSSPFTRLREINFILNASPSIRRPIHFVYMVRDDLFTSRDRVKFFDYVIPIVSVINTDNSRQMMLDIMDAKGWMHDVRPSRNVIEAVSYHVDDMRLLVNMLNEYDLMRSVLDKNTGLDKDKMFAAVVSRCLFPREYAQLLRGRGVLAKLVSSYSEWSKERMAEIQREVGVLESKVSAQPHELAAAEKELRALIWMAASERESDYVLESISDLGGVSLNFNQFIKQGLNESLKPGDALVLNFPALGTRRVEYRDLLGKGSGSLDSRLAAAREVAAGSARRLSELRRKLADSELTALSEALKDSAFVAHVAKMASELNLGPVGFFVTKGLLGEDYFDYSGYFYAGSISRTDKALMLRVKAGELLPVEARIDDPGEFLRRMSAAELREGRGILLSIVTYIFSEEHDGDDSTIDWKEVILRESALHPARVAELIHGMSSHGVERPLIDFLLARNPGVVLSAVQPGAACGDAPWREKIVAQVLSIAPFSKESIGEAALEAFEQIVSSITDGAQFASSVSDTEKVKGWLDDRKVWLSQIDEVFESEVMDQLMLLNAPAVNMHNIRSFANFFDPPLTSGGFSIGWMRAQAEGPLRKWLVQNQDVALEAVLEQDGELIEDAKDVEWIIAQIDDDPALLDRAVERLIFQAESLDGFPDQLWPRMLVGKVVETTWYNIEKVLRSTDGERLQEVVAAIIKSELSLKQLEKDVHSIDGIDASQFAWVVKRMAELSGEEQHGLAVFLARSGVAVRLPDDFDPGFSRDSVRSMLEDMSGQWCEWLWSRAAKDDGPWLSMYLASCAADPRALKGSSDVPAKVLVDAASLIAQPAAVEKFLATFLARVTDWSQETSDSACELIVECDKSNAGAAMRIVQASSSTYMLEEADRGPSFSVLEKVVGHADWAAAKPLVEAASHAVLLGLSNAQGTVALPVGKETHALAVSLHMAGVIRKPKHRKGSVVLTATAKY